MEIVLEVPDQDAARVLELIRGIKRVKVKSPKNAPTATELEFMEDLREAGRDLARIRNGEELGQSWDELYAELKSEETAEKLPKEELPIAEREPAPKPDKHDKSEDL